MSRGGIIFLVIVAAVGGAAAGYWFAPSPTVTRDSPPLAEATAAEAVEATGSVFIGRF